MFPSEVDGLFHCICKFVEYSFPTGQVDVPPSLTNIKQINFGYFILLQKMHTTKHVSFHRVRRAITNN